MFPFGHVGLTLALAEAARRFPALARIGTLPVLALAVGAMLPDAIDKPLGHWILDWGTGRLIGHSLVFLLALAVAAWVARSRGSPRAAGVALALVLGTATHLVFDQMWATPEVLLWPLFGPFPHGDFEPSGWIAALLTNRFIQATELLGAAGLAWAAWAEARRRRVAR
ncbi:MAG TPA: metal-dependent hydrolase [Candidatus Thermoplasmatota archaeon]|nr:metal-dependent hydrolase [Candidatus Thermoplasmatota archaeon]